MLSNITAAVTVVALFASSALSQPAVAPSAAPGAATSTPAASSAAPLSQPVSQQELDQLLAPIALYPDALLAQVLMASTYPLEVVEAARWSKANPGVSDKALENAMVSCMHSATWIFERIETWKSEKVVVFRMNRPLAANSLNCRFPVRLLEQLN